MAMLDQIVDTVVATAALTNRRVVNFSGAHGAADNYGVARADAAVGQACPVAMPSAIVELEANAAIPLGTRYLIAGADGRVGPGGTAAACTAKLRPGQSATAAGQIVEAFFLGLV